ncbi:MAG: branched-chain amino acid ABC transporter permease [Phycisphaerae bacterium]
MNTLLETLMNGLAVGSLYALIALGYTMVYGILKFINFAHSDVFVVGAWMSLTIATAAGWTGETQGPPTWLWYSLCVVGVLGLTGAVWRAVSPRVESDGAFTLVARRLQFDVWPMVAIWAWVVVGLFYAVQVLKAQGFAFVGAALVLIAAMLACGLLGFLIERFAYRPLRNAPRLNVLITAIGVSLLLQNTGQLKWFFGPSPKRMPDLMPDIVLNESLVARGTVMPADGGKAQLDAAFEVLDGRDYRLDIASPAGGWAQRRVTATAGMHPAGHPIDVLPPTDEAVKGHAYRMVLVPKVPIRLVDVMGAGTALLLMLVLEWLVFRTKLGRAMRAVSFNHNTAALMGINVDRVISFTFVLGSMLAAAAGFLYAMKYPGLNQPAYTSWVLLGLKAFVAAVVGGIGNIRGAMLGGIFIGLIEFFGVTYISTDYRDVYVFSILILVLLFRPSGLLGRATVEKV